MAGPRRPDYRRRIMGIETILVVGIVVIVLSLAIGLGRAKRKARAARGENPETGRPDSAQRGPTQTHA